MILILDNKSKKNTDNLKQSLNLNNQMLAKFPQLQKIENEKNNNDLKLYLNDFASKESETNVIASFPRLRKIEKEKGCPIDYIPDHYILIDLETTGFNSKKDNIIEIACIKINEGKEIDRFETLINPNMLIPQRIIEITGINNDMIVDSPKFEDIVTQLWKFLKDEIIVGHNIKFDISFLYEKFLNTAKLKFTNNYLDTLSLSRKIYKNFDSYKLEDLTEKLSIESDHHRAMADCLAVKNLIDKMMSEIINKKMLIHIPAYKLLDFDSKVANKYVLNLIKTIEEEDYLTFGIVSSYCDKLVDNGLATVSLCKKMASVCEKFEEYEEAISLYETAMELDPELDYYKKIERLEKKVYNF